MVDCENITLDNGKSEGKGGIKSERYELLRSA